MVDYFYLKEVRALNLLFPLTKKIEGLGLGVERVFRFIQI